MRFGRLISLAAVASLGLTGCWGTDGSSSQAQQKQPKRTGLWLEKRMSSSTQKTRGRVEASRDQVEVVVEAQLKRLVQRQMH